MKTIVFVTGNPYKFEVAQKSFENSDINIVQQEIETPEIQSTDVKEIASYSAKWAAEKLGKPVVLTDAGYYIKTLNGFPGPFIKYINKWLTAEDVLKLRSILKKAKSRSSSQQTLLLEALIFQTFPML